MTSEPLPRAALSRAPSQSFGGLSASFLEEYLDKIVISAGHLDEEQLWWRPARGTNSVGNLILHLCGNLSLWILKSLGEKEYTRERSKEFTSDRTHSKEELFAAIRGIVGRCRPVLEGQTDLERKVLIQKYETSVLGAIYHAVEHMGYHTGQIVFAVKQLVGDKTEIEFYPRHKEES